MSKTLLRSALLAAALGLSTLATPVQAAPTSPDLAPSWSAIVKTLAAVFGWLDLGCSMDPDGACRAGQPAEDLDGGCSIDPSGACQASQPPAGRLDAGCSADPDGRCEPRPVN
jgi:hypothetical protein